MTVSDTTDNPLDPRAISFAIRSERASDVAAREALLDECFGLNRDARTCQRLRDGRLAALAFSAVSSAICRKGKSDQNAAGVVGSVRLWHVDAGGVPALMLGPLAVDPSCRNLGIGGALVKHALTAARARGFGAVLLLGDAPYYARFGFSVEKTGALLLPGPFERDRLLALELRTSALDDARGVIVPTGKAALLGQAPLSRTPRKLAARAA
jgi:predicted N-acetyltransferase YhbS